MRLWGKRISNMKELDVCEGDKEEVVDQDEDSVQILAD